MVIGPTVNANSITVSIEATGWQIFVSPAAVGGVQRRINLWQFWETKYSWKSSFRSNELLCVRIRWGDLERCLPRPTYLLPVWLNCNPLFQAVQEGGRLREKKFSSSGVIALDFIPRCVEMRRLCRRKMENFSFNDYARVAVYLSEIFPTFSVGQACVRWPIIDDGNEALIMNKSCFIHEIDWEYVPCHLRDGCWFVFVCFIDWKW